MSDGLTVTPSSGAANVWLGAALSGVNTASLPDATPTPAPAPLLAAPTTSALSQKFTVDPKTQDAIYRLVDTRTQQVIQQSPDQAQLASRAYSDAIQSGATPFEAQFQADIEI